MQIAPPIALSELASPDADNRQREFAHRLAETHTLEVSPPQKTTLLEDLHSWELALRNANAIFKAVPSPRDAPISRAGEWSLKRVEEYTLPLESARALKAYGTTSAINKLLIVNKESRPGRTTMILVKENLGF